MTERERLVQLEQLAKENHDLLRDASNDADSNRLIESLQIYQAELELQNQELIETQAELTAEKKRYRDLFMLQPLANIMLDPQGVMLETNDAVNTLFSLPPNKSAQGKSVYHFLAQDSALWLKAILSQQASSKEAALHQRISVINGAGETIQCRATLWVMPTSSIYQAFAMLSLEDVSKEARLESETVLFQAMLDHTQSLIFSIDSELRLLLANKSFLRFHGLSSQRSGCVSVRDFFAAESIQRIKSYYDTLFIRGIPVTYEYEYQHNDKLKFIQTSAFPLRDDLGSIYAAGFISTDITDKMNAEIRLQTALQVFSEGSEAVIITDQSLRINQVNARFVELFGCSSSSVQGLVATSLFDSPALLNDYSDIENELARSGFWEGEIEAKHASGRRFSVWLRLSRVPKEGVFRNYLLIASDLSEAKAKEAHISQLAYHDSLTGLANRLQLREVIDNFIENKAVTDSSFSILFLDLDHFKAINDVHGACFG